MNNSNNNMKTILSKYENSKKSILEMSKNIINEANQKLTQKSIDFTKINEKDYQGQTIDNNKNRNDPYINLINKIKYLSNENQKFLSINKSIKKELINNTLLLSKKNNQLSYAQKEKSEFIEQINILQKDNEALMELIHDKNNDSYYYKNNYSNELLLIEEKENIIQQLNKQINTIKNNYENKLLNKSNEIKKLNKSVKELHESLKSYKKNISNVKKGNIIFDKNAKNNFKKINDNIKSQKIYDFSYVFMPSLGGNNKFPKDKLIIKRVDNFNFILNSLNLNLDINSFENNNNNNKLIEELENKISELKEKIVEKQNINDKIENENSILKNFTTNKSNINEDNEKTNENEKLKKYEADINSKDKQIKLLENKIITLENELKKFEELNKQKTDQLENKNLTKKKMLLDSKDNDNISQLKEELSEKDNEIEYLKIEIQELKTKLQDYEENFNSSSVNQNNENELDEKIKFLNKRNEYYQKLSSDYEKKINDLEKLNQNLKNEIENYQKEKNIKENGMSDTKESITKVPKKYSSKEYTILYDVKYKNLKWYLMVSKQQKEISMDNILVYNYDNMFWVPKINIIDIESFNYNKCSDDNNKEEKNNKEISFTSNVNNYSFHNNLDMINKIKSNNNESPKSKNENLFSLGNNNNIVDESNDYNKLMDKFKALLDKLNKINNKYNKLYKRYNELKEKAAQNNNIEVSFSEKEDSSNGIDMFNEDDNLNLNKNNREHQYYEQNQIELEATKKQLLMIKNIYKELEKKYQNIKQLCENLFSKLTLKKKEKEEFKALLQLMDFSDEKISLIIDKKKK